MDEEEELENTLIGQQQEEESPAVNTGDVMMGGLGLGGAAFAAQTGRAPTPTPSGSLSPFAQQVAANDAARQAAARAASTASQPLGNLPRIGTLNPATGPSGGTTLPSQPSLQEARQAAARSAGVNPLSASRLARSGGPGALIYGAADLGLEALTDRGLSERIGEGVGEAVGNLLFPGAQSQPAFTEAETLQDLVGQAPASTTDSFDRSAVRSGRSRAGEGGQDALGDFLSSFEFQGRRGQRTGDSSVVQTPLTLPPAAQSFFGQTPASNAAEAAQRLIDAGPAFTQGQAPALDPTSDEAILPTQGQATTAPTSGLTTVGGASLSEFLSGQAMPERGFVREERPLSGRGVTLTPEQMNELSAEREARLAARIPGDQTAVDTRAAQSRTTGGQTEGLSFDDARRRAEGQLAARGIRNPSVSQVNALARSIQAAEPERLAELETQRALTQGRIDALDAQLAQSGIVPSAPPVIDPETGVITQTYTDGTTRYKGLTRVIEDTPEKTGLQATLENLQSDLDSGRLTQEEYDIASKNAKDRYIGREKPKPAKPEETSGLIDMDGEAPVATETAPQTRVTINTQAEYDALAVGTPYIDSQGTPGIKK